MAGTCDTEPAGLVLCNGNLSTNAPAFVARVQIGEGATAQLSLSGFKLTPLMMVLVGPGCAGGSCLAGDLSTPLSLAEVPPGEYDLLVTSNPETGTAGDCGTFSLSLVGDFGVFDRIFGDGLD